MKKTLINAGVGIGVWAAPLAVFAQSFDSGELSAYIGNIILFINDTLVPFIFALAFLVFVWGAFQYFIFSKGSEEGQEKAKNLMLWGIIGFFVMVAIWGIVNLLVGASGFGGESLQDLPQAPTR
jgi:hypothetical protein